MCVKFKIQKTYFFMIQFFVVNFTIFFLWYAAAYKLSCSDFILSNEAQVSQP